MTKIALEYIGLHLPKEIIEVDEDIASGLIKRGDYRRVAEKKEEKIKSKSVKEKG